jgi:hypothetical protein
LLPEPEDVPETIVLMCSRACGGGGTSEEEEAASADLAAAVKGSEEGTTEDAAADVAVLLPELKQVAFLVLANAVGRVEREAEVLA